MLRAGGLLPGARPAPWSPARPPPTRTPRLAPDRAQLPRPRAVHTHRSNEMCLALILIQMELTRSRIEPAPDVISGTLPSPTLQVTVLCIRGRVSSVQCPVVCAENRGHGQRERSASPPRASRHPLRPRRMSRPRDTPLYARCRSASGPAAVTSPRAAHDQRRSASACRGVLVVGVPRPFRSPAALLRPLPSEVL